MNLRPDADPRFHVTPADWRADFDALRVIRETVFVAEQRVRIEEEWDDADPHCAHVLARDAEGAPVGTARMEPSGKIGRMAVLPDWRRHGVGAAMLQTLLDLARSRRLTEVRCHAQVTAIEFYRRFGFEPVGERFMEAGIEHQLMCLAVEAPAAPPRAPSDLPPSRPARAIETLDEAVAALTEAIPLARGLIRIHSHELDPELLGDPAVLAALRGFAAGRRGAEVRVLVQDPAEAQRQRNGLFELAQRLSSCFRFRVPVEPQDLDYAPSYLVTDRGGFLFRTLGSRYDGEASPCLPARARELVQHFDPTWERSRPASEFRALGI